MSHRVIEHGTLMDEATAQFVAEQGTFVVPTVVIVFALAELGEKLGVRAESREKARHVRKQILQGLECMRRAGVRVGFGTDLLGETYVQQCREFTIRKEIFSPLEILRQATSTNAAILQQEGKLGCVKPGAHADLLVVDGDPLKDIELLAPALSNTRLHAAGGRVFVCHFGYSGVTQCCGARQN